MEQNNYVEITNRKQEIVLQRIALNKSNETCDESIKQKKLKRETSHQLTVWMIPSLGGLYA